MLNLKLRKIIMSRQFIRTLIDKGFTFYRRGKGSHIIYRNEQLNKQVVIPDGREINKMIARRLLKEIEQCERSLQ